ncbi:MAG TPA: hypothetical protein VIY54_00060 [Steroidobacteraceae bacterium]
MRSRCRFFALRLLITAAWLLAGCAAQPTALPSMQAELAPTRATATRAAPATRATATTADPVAGALALFAQDAPSARGVPRAAGGAPAQGVGGNGATAQERPDGNDDVLIAQRLRKAALQEPDPELRRKLWREYQTAERHVAEE